MHGPVTVSTLNEQIKNLLEATFMQIYVEGELSRITYHNSGHVYFTLKDRESAISGVMFRGNASRLRFRLEEGLKVVVQGAVTVYKPRGSYQINAAVIEPAGHGALALAFEQLKQRLSAEGLFDPMRKKPLPKFPSRIALITSATGAALQDMRRVAAHRWPLAELAVFDAIVQGEQSAPSVTYALQTADRGGFDLLVLSRGGGSIEDLWGFNDEALARAIAAAQTPVVSAVGHEIDWVISDFVADVRAPTPSAAMQMVLPDQNEMLLSLDALRQQYDGLIRERLQRRAEQLHHLKERYERHSIDRKITEYRTTLAQIRRQFDQQIDHRLTRAASLITPLRSQQDYGIRAALERQQSRLGTLQTALLANNPAHKQRQGYAQVVKDDRPVDLGTLQTGDTIALMDTQRTVTAEVTQIVRRGPAA